jgi:hypothetical protein
MPGAAFVVRFEQPSSRPHGAESDNKANDFMDVAVALSDVGSLGAGAT